MHTYNRCTRALNNSEHVRTHTNKYARAPPAQPPNPPPQPQAQPTPTTHTVSQVGTRNKDAMIEVRNVGEYEFPFSAASNYADATMAALPIEVCACVRARVCMCGWAPAPPSCARATPPVSNRRLS